MASNIFIPPFLKNYLPSPSFFKGKAFFKTLIMTLNIQRVKSVPPIPTTTIVIPNVQLSMMYLLMIYGEGMNPTKTTSPVDKS